MSKWIFLSYLLTENTPAYGGGKAFSSRIEKSIDNGDSCNTSQWTMSNHIGTHIDFPKHFSKSGNTLDRYPANFWIFNHIGFIDISPVDSDQIITKDDISLEKLNKNTELLIIKTDFSGKRNNQAYWRENPGFHPHLYKEIRKILPGVRVVGFDVISISSFTNRDIGRATHREFLSGDKPILLLEDMDLRQITETTVFKQIITLPLPVEGADAAPCNIIAEVD